MSSVLFLQSSTDDPFTIYTRMQKDHPVWLDEANQCWAVYSYEHCRAILTDPNARIPQPALSWDKGLNEHALRMAGKLARFSNPPLHAFYRQAAMRLFEKMKPVPAGPILDRLIVGVGSAGSEGAGSGAMSGAGAVQAGAGTNIDWAGSVGKRLPAAIILEGFGFGREDSELILSGIGQIAAIMHPGKTAGRVASINEAAGAIWRTTEKVIAGNGLLEELIGSVEETISRQEQTIIYISNLIGLLIQSYDAGRGVLCNSLLQVLLQGGLPAARSGERREAELVGDRETQPVGGRRAGDFFYRSVVESLRYDPPVHNTRRVAINDILINGKTIGKGQTILVVLAAGNRDPKKFRVPDQYDIYRENNGDHITFGMGPHACLARDFSTDLAARALSWLFGKYRRIGLTGHAIKYEPLVNARIPGELFISLEP